MYSYYANNPIIAHLTEEQLEAAYRVRQMQYRIEDVKTHALDLLNNDDITEDQYNSVCDSAQVLAERFIYKLSDCTLPENDVFENMIMDYVNNELDIRPSLNSLIESAQMHVESHFPSDPEPEKEPER